MTNNFPHNLHTEQAVLGSLLTYKNAFAHIGGLNADHFFESLHARIFDAAQSIFNEGGAVSALTIAPLFKNNKSMQQIGGDEYFSRLVSGAATMFELPDLAMQIIGLSQRRVSIDIAQTIIADATELDYSQSFSELIPGHLDNLTAVSVTGGGNRKTDYTFAESGAAVIEKLSRLYDGGVDPDAIPTGLSELDNLTGGLHRNELAVLGGRPGMGKTALGIQIAKNVSKAGQGVVYFSMEMAHDALTRRAVSSRVWLPNKQVSYNRITVGKVDETELRWLTSAASEMGNYPIIIDDQTGLTPGELEAKLRVYKSRFERSGKTLDLVVIDHLHQMHFPAAHSETERYSRISTALMQMSKRLNCAVLCLAQLNRGVEGRDDKRPGLADLRQSGTIEQDADIVLFAYRESYYVGQAFAKCQSMEQEADVRAALAECDNKIELIIAKQRNGPVGNINLFCDIGSNVIRDFDGSHLCEVAA